MEGLLIRYCLHVRTRALLALLSVCSSCSSNSPFTPAKWAEKDDITYVNRSTVLPDLLEHHQLAGLSYSQLKALLGKPQGVDTTTSAIRLTYLLEEDYGSDIDPVSSKSLLFRLDQDSIVTRYEVVEYQHEK